MEIREYRRAASVEEAYELIQKSRQNVILGGCTFLRKTGRNIGIAVDLQDCGLDYIRETETEIRIGAYTCFRDLETSARLHELYGDVFREVFKHLIGVQLRNHITIGGHVYSRFGFSDLIPVLLSLNARVKLYRGGELSLNAFMREDIRTVKGDVLTEVILPKEGRKAVVQMARSSYNDYSIFCMAASRTKNDWVIAAGVLPGRAMLAEKTMERLKGVTLSEDQIEQLAMEITGEFRFGNNFRASGEYREALCGVFARRALERLKDKT